jgi:hypothetical protein
MDDLSVHIRKYTVKILNMSRYKLLNSTLFPVTRLLEMLNLGLEELKPFIYVCVQSNYISLYRK